MSTEPLDEIQWKSPEWIQQFGLFTGNVLDYFAESPFYDRTSNNQVLRMQFQFQQIPPHIHPQKYLQSKLAEMVGTEFVIAFVREPNFWVIRRQRRLDASTTVTEQDYYIIGANVYQSPRIYDVLSARLLSSVLSMKKSLSLLNSMSSFSVSEGGHVYPSDLGEIAPSKGVVPETPSSVSNPGTVSKTTNAALTSGIGPGLSVAAEILAAAFDNLLGSVVANASSGKSIYIDDVPLHGKGSTVELLGLKLNLNDD